MVVHCMVLELFKVKFYIFNISFKSERYLFFSIFTCFGLIVFKVI